LVTSGLESLLSTELPEKSEISSPLPLEWCQVPVLALLVGKNRPREVVGEV
jgi:hypothetical protein